MRTIIAPLMVAKLALARTERISLAGRAGPQAGNFALRTDRARLPGLRHRHNHQQRWPVGLLARSPAGYPMKYSNRGPRESAGEARPAEVNWSTGQVEREPDCRPDRFN